MSEISGLFFDDSAFPGADVVWNTLEADFDPANEEFERDVLFIRFPNACILDVAWRGGLSSAPVGFTISLVHTDGGWEPFKQIHCRRLGDLRELVQTCAEEAASRPSIRRHLSGEWLLHSPFHEPPVDNLILDPLAPLAGQLDALSNPLFVGLGGRHNIIISWEPPRSANGSFLVRTYKYDATWFETHETTGDDETYPPPWWTFDREWRCATVDELRQRVEAIDLEWRRSDS